MYVSVLDLHYVILRTKDWPLKRDLNDLQHSFSWKMIWMTHNLPTVDTWSYLPIINSQFVIFLSHHLLSSRDLTDPSSTVDLWSYCSTSFDILSHWQYLQTTRDLTYPLPSYIDNTHTRHVILLTHYLATLTTPTDDTWSYLNKSWLTHQLQSTRDHTDRPRTVNILS
jgi:hypothetical protein